MSPIERGILETSPRESSIHDLPAEVLIFITENLCLADLQRSRLVCLKWASNLAHLLFANGLVLRPDRNDMSKLQNLSQRPDLAAGIRNLEIYAGDMDLEQLHTVFENYDKHYQSNLITVMERLEKHRGTHLNLHDLSTAFSRLLMLKSLTISSMRYPFSEFNVEDPSQGSQMRDMSKPAWKFFWASFPTTMSHQAPGLAIERYRSILLALQDSPSEIEKLDLDMIPLQCFADISNPNEMIFDTKILEQTRKATEKIKDLRVSFISCGDRRSEDPVIGHGIAHWLSTMQHVRALDLTWNLETNAVRGHQSFWDAWSQRFYDSWWPSLHSLRLRNAGSSNTQVFAFLQKHSPTLRRLHLSGQPIRIIEAGTSHKDMLMDIWRHLNLAKLEYITDLDGKNRHRIYEDDWTPIIGPSSKLGIASTTTKLLEDFVLRGAAWPMAGNDPDEFGIWVVRDR